MLIFCVYFVLVHLTTFKNCQSYERPLTPMNLMKMTMSHARATLQRSDATLVKLRENMLDISRSDEPAYGMLLITLRYAFELQQRIRYALHLLQFTKQTKPRAVVARTWPIKENKFLSEAIYKLMVAIENKSNSTLERFIKVYPNAVRERIVFFNLRKFLLSLAPNDITEARATAKLIRENINNTESNFIKTGDYAFGMQEHYGKKLLELIEEFDDYDYPLRESQPEEERELDNLFSKFLKLVDKVYEKGYWPSLLIDEEDINVNETSSDVLNTGKMANKTETIPGKPHIRRGYLTEALLRLTSYVQEMNATELNVILKGYKDMIKDFLKYYGLTNTKVGVYLTDLQLFLKSAETTKVFANIYNDELTKTKHPIIQTGDSILRENEKKGDALLKSIELLRSFRKEESGVERGEQLCRKMLDTFFQCINRLSDDMNKPQLFQRSGFGTRVTRALGLTRKGFARIQDDLMYVIYILDLNEEENP